jgi:hypothetical protein
MQPAEQIDAPKHRPTFAQTGREHDPHSESEKSTRAQEEPQRAEIAPLQPPLTRQETVQPWWDEYDAGNWATQRAIETAKGRYTAVFATPEAATPPSVPSVA